MTQIEDFRRLAKKRTPKMFYDYADSGSWTEQTYMSNQQDFTKLLFRQRVAVNIEHRRLTSSMLKQDISMPIAIAPMGLLGMQYADGEMIVAQVAKKMNIPFTLSTMSICSIEDVSKSIGGAPFWFQLYMMKDRGFMSALIQRAKNSGCSALVLTLDLQVLGQRHKDVKNGLSAPPKPTLLNILNLMTKPKWCLKMAQTKRHGFGNIIGHAKGVDNMGSLSEWTQKQFDTSLTWDDIAWVKSQWDGPLVLKGILDIDDAKRAVQTGADALIVSNHGGRQLDGAPSSIQVLPRIVDAVGTQIEVHFDGGIRSGQDVLKAVAMGAKGVYLGRSILYALAADGAVGVEKAISIIRNELDISMAFCGETDIQQVDRSIFYTA